MTARHGWIRSYTDSALSLSQRFSAVFQRHDEFCYLAILRSSGTWKLLEAWICSFVVLLLSSFFTLHSQSQVSLYCTISQLKTLGATGGWNEVGESVVLYRVTALPSISKYKEYYFLTLILLTWRIWWAPNNAGKWQIGFNSAFKGLI